MLNNKHQCLAYAVGVVIMAVYLRHALKELKHVASMSNERKRRYMWILRMSITNKNYDSKLRIRKFNLTGGCNK